MILLTVSAFPAGGVGGVKRPAEGSKEEPSEKKNIPVVVKSFVSKTAIENRPPPSVKAETSPELPRAADKVGYYWLVLISMLSRRRYSQYMQVC